MLKIDMNHSFLSSLAMLQVRKEYHRDPLVWDIYSASSKQSDYWRKEGYSYQEIIAAETKAWQEWKKQREKKAKKEMI